MWFYVIIYLMTNPERDAYYEAIVQVMGRGFTMISSEIGELAVAFGYSENSPPLASLENMRASAYLSRRGVEIGQRKYSSKNIYFDQNADLIDEAASERLIDRQVTEARNKQRETLAAFKKRTAEA